MPQISVIVPVYKVEPYLRRCVDSILNQTFTDFELILVDDGSPDVCGAICDEYIDPRITVIHQPNGGLSAARNSGIDWAFACSDSEWLGFVDSDDWVHPKYLEALYQAAEHSNFDIAIGEFEPTEGANPCVDETQLRETIWNVEEFYCKHYVTATVAWGKIYHKNCFNDIRYPVGKIHEDEYVSYKILFSCKQVAVVNETLYAYYQNLHGIMQSNWSIKRFDVFEAFEEQIAYFQYYQLYKACAVAKKRYSIALLANVRILNEIANNNDLKRKEKYCQKKLKKLILKNYNLFPFVKENMWFYEGAFPIFMRVFWIASRKLKDVLQLTE